MSNYSHPLAEYWEDNNQFHGIITINEGFWFDPDPEINSLEKPVTEGTTLEISIERECCLVELIEHYAGSLIFPIKAIWHKEVDLHTGLGEAMLLLFDEMVD